MKGTVFSIFLFAIAMQVYPQNCYSKKICQNNDLGERYDYRGQSVHERLMPGDTSKIKVVLYRNNDIRISVCSDEKLGDVSFKIYNSMREYVKVPDRIEKIIVKKPIYKKNSKGDFIPSEDNWGDVVRDEYGDTVYEVETYKEEISLDTVWRTIRNFSENILFDSGKGADKASFYSERVAHTKSVTIEVIVPPAVSDEGVKYAGCVSVLVGRKMED